MRQALHAGTEDARQVSASFGQPGPPASPGGGPGAPAGRRWLSAPLKLLGALALRQVATTCTDVASADSGASLDCMQIRERGAWYESAALRQASDAVLPRSVQDGGRTELMPQRLVIWRRTRRLWSRRAVPLAGELQVSGTAASTHGGPADAERRCPRLCCVLHRAPRLCCRPWLAARM